MGTEQGCPRSHPKTPDQKTLDTPKTSLANPFISRAEIASCEATYLVHVRSNASGGLGQFTGKGSHGAT